MASAATHRIAHADSTHAPGILGGMRRTCAHFFLARCMMAAVEHTPWLLRAIRPVVLPLTWLASATLRRNLMLNARRLLGDHSTTTERRRLSRTVLGNFYDILINIGRTGRRSPAQWRQEVSAVEGEDRYLAIRAQRRGAILVTAHLGAFEHGVAALRAVEPHVHIVFRRDPMPRFERLRSAQHARFGVIEAPVDDGLPVWFGLRDALQRNEVVLMQGDRVMPGQPGTSVPFLGGTMRVPLGPIKLAQAAGAPIVPTFAIREKDGRVRIVLEEPIEVDPDEPPIDDVPAALHRLIAVIETYVRRYPEQWLMVQPALEEDALPLQPAASPSHPARAPHAARSPRSSHAPERAV